jgi:phytoene synthase
MATRFLPNKKQRGIFAVYALCRSLDNIADIESAVSSTALSKLDKIHLLEQWKFDLIQLYNNNYKGNNPILLAFRDTISAFNIKLDLPLLLIEGITSDLTKNRYQNFNELYEYSYRVASVVGLMTTEIFGYSDEKALDYAVDLGIAMQLTNILRDVGEDLQKNRIYLPLNELADYGIDIEELFNHQCTDRFKEFMKFQINRARNYYQNAEKGIIYLSKEARLPVYLAHFNYQRILGKIEEIDYQVFTRRAYVSKREKLMSIPEIYWNKMYAKDKER